MKVFKNYLRGMGYGNGVLIVAADSMEQAQEVCFNSDILRDVYWCDVPSRTKEGVPFTKRTECEEWNVMCYPKNTFEEVKGMEWHGEPCVIEEVHFID